MRKKLSLAVSVFVFVLVFSFFKIDSFASASSFESNVRFTKSSWYHVISSNKTDSFSNIASFDFNTIFDDSIPNADLYRVNITSNAVVNVSRSDMSMVNFSVIGQVGNSTYSFNDFGYNVASSSFSNSNTFDIFVSRNVGLVSPYFLCHFDSGTSSYTATVDLHLDIEINSITPLTSSQTNEYQSGYNTGYADGLSQGQSSGYNSGYSDGYTAGQESVDTDGLYESGYQAGVDSVDTESFYNSGYSNGYSGGYNAGYDTGYNTGYSDAVAAIEKLGADMTEYPVEMTTFYGSAFSEQKEVYYGEMHDITFVARATSFSDSFINKIDPHHTYCFSGGISNFAYSYSNLMNLPTYDVILEIGGYDYVISSGSNAYYSDSEFNFRFFIPGERMSTGYSLKYRFYDVQSNDKDIVAIIVAGHSSFMGYIADYGPANSEQNHIANQTDELTNGYDSSAGSAASSSLASGSADYTSAESNLFASATSSLGNFSFVDISAFPAVISGISFVSSIMTGIFDSMGGANGAGIVLSVLFSTMFVSMVVGIYRWYQSGGKGGRSKGGGK